MSRRWVQRSVPFFDEIANDWAGQYDEPTAAGHALRERRRRLLELLQGREGNLLDVGCGSAVLAESLETRGWRYTGIDGSEAMIGAARRRLAARGGSCVAVADVAALPFADDAFDAVLCIGVLDRVVDQQAAVGELVRVVRPGGRAVVSFANRHSPYARWNSDVFRPLVGQAKRVVTRGGHARADLASPALLHTPRTACTLLAAAGARPASVAYYHHNVLLSPIDELFPGVAERLAVRLEPLHQSRWRWLAVGFLVAADKQPVRG
jgi:ubiquinone/menaquinone biosynthesis C-methylase UbiE